MTRAKTLPEHTQYVDPLPLEGDGCSRLVALTVRSEAEKAFREAVRQFENDLRSVPGLFGTSEVTQEQLDLAKAGVPQEFADDFLHRFKDQIGNG